MELSIRGVTKKYTDKTAVNNASLEITSGVWGLLGANGAGKTTLMRMIADILKPTSGDIFYDGISISTLKAEYRNIFGYLPQEFGFYPEFSVNDYLEYISTLKGISYKESKKRIDELLDQMTLSDVKYKKIRKLSGGMKRRVGIAQALLNNPDILILDEPTSGLDPGERIRLRSLLSEFSKEKIVLISTHIVSDVEYIATKQAIMKDGRILRTGSTDELIGEVRNKVWECIIDNETFSKYSSKIKIVNMKNESMDEINLRYVSDEMAIPGSQSTDPRLEDLYLYLFNESVQESN